MAENENIRSNSETNGENSTLDSYTHGTTAMRTRVPVSEEMKNYIVRKYNAGFKVAFIAEDLGKSYQTVNTIVKNYLQTGSVAVKRRGPAPGFRKISGEAARKLEEKIESSPFVRYKDMKEFLEQEHDLVVSFGSLRKFLLERKITLKRAVNVNERVNDPEIKEERKEYARWFTRRNRGDLKNYIFIDETPLNLHLKRNYGYAKTGISPRQVVAANRGRNLTLISAINCEEVIYSEIIEGGAQDIDFENFLNALKDELRARRMLELCTLIYDNAAIHHAQRVRDFCEVYQLNVKYLSRYSYMLNPIEFCFGKIKTYIRNIFSLDPEKSIVTLALEGIRSVNENDLRGYFELITRNCVQAVALEDF